ncbi:MAG: hypothetical protein ACE5EX_00755, partial [Phycisphaerae bacterium]
MSSPPVVSAGRAEFRAAVAEPVATKAAPRRSYRAELTIASGGGGLLICFSVTLLLSATLLFLVQPMVGKMILPYLGGTPAVWTTCMVFFQATLLAGYAYAHLAATRLGLGSQTALHALVLVVPLAVLPIVVRGGAAPPTEGNPTIWLLGCLLVSAGLPFFVVSATGPLLQRWFAMTPHPSAHDPYFLYAASNAGSLVALLGYPLLLEPYLPLADQSIVWAFGYAVLFILIAMSAILVVRCSAGVAGTHDTRLPQTEGRTQSSATRDVGLAERVEAITLRRRLWWVFAAAVPSSLMLGVTTHITTNLAPVPLLWVLPLAIYLLTFILVFARSRPIPHRWMVRLLPFLLPPAVAITFLDLPRMGWVAIVVHLATFFVAAMVCHGALSDRRPAAGRLTEFYLCLSIGGVLGGVFNAIVAPLVFRSIVEYPLAMVLACLFLPRRNGSAPEASGRRMDWLIPLGLAGVAATGLLILRAGAWGESLGLRLVVFGPMALACFALKDRPLRFALGMAVLMLTLGGYVALHRGTGLYAGRNFYGVKRVAVDGEGVFRVLTHGNTTHGKQFIDEARSDEPLTYYHRRGPLGDVFAAVRKTGRTASVGVIGLGAGS